MIDLYFELFQEVEKKRIQEARKIYDQLIKEMIEKEFPDVNRDEITIKWSDIHV